MRTVQMFSTIATDDGITASPGDRIELDDDRAAELVDSGFAEYTDGDRQAGGRRRRPVARRSAKLPADTDPAAKNAPKGDGDGEGK
ncbi:hypothetical protein [Streptomyces sp.]|uniref:hypothetical protein n=1 Tax=Streptomyces sp. TaxID=1931 RepID=UPI002F92B87B